ncbi:MAG: hypothetical protein ABIS84_07180 [Arachnia sp.]
MRSRGTWGPWVGFALVVAACLVFAVGAGAWIVRAAEPSQLGRGRLGDWAELGGQGFRVRLDDVSLATSFPSSYDPATEVEAPEGFAFLRVRMTVESAVGSEEAMGCLLKLRNSGGEDIGNREYGVDGPTTSECNQSAAADELGAPVGVGDRFASQSVFVVVPEDLDSYTLDVVPLFADDDVYWRFDLG